MHYIVLMHVGPEGTLRGMIRLARAEDGDEVARIYDPVVAHTAISFELEPPGPPEMRRRIQQTLPFAPWLVDERDGTVRGYAYASKHRDRAAYQWSVDVAVYVDEAHRRSGVGRALYEKLFRLLRLQGFYKAHAGITLPNAASVGVHEALGFRPVGIYRGVGYKQAAWRDVGWWQLALRECESEPAPPKTMAELESDPRWVEEIRR